MKMQPWLSLAAICFALGALLGVTQWQTAPTIAANRQAQALAGLRQLIAPLPLATAGADAALTQLAASGLWPMCQQATVAQTAAKGYGGPIVLFILYQPVECSATSCAAHSIAKLQVAHHNETPGIGDFFERRQPDWLARVAQQGLTPTGAKVDAVTGATITADAIVTAIRANANRVSAQPFAADPCPGQSAPSA